MLVFPLGRAVALWGEGVTVLPFRARGFQSQFMGGRLLQINGDAFFLRGGASLRHDFVGLLHHCQVF